MNLMEWAFATAHTDGTLISMDGSPALVEMTVQTICKYQGWEIEHAVYDHKVAHWQIILSRPLQPMMPTRGHLDDAVMIGAA